MNDPDSASATIRCVECGREVARSDAFGIGDELRCAECAQGVRRRLHARHRPSLKLKRPIATITVLAISAALFVAGYVARREPDATLPAWLAALHQDMSIWSGAVWKHASSIFLHGGLMHIVMNGFALWQLGQIIEAVWGRTTFLALLLGAGTAGAAASWVMNAPTPSVGLSGGIFGLAAFLFAVRRDHAVAAAVATTQFRNSLLAWFGLCLILTFTKTLPISNSGHAIGALTGWLIGRAHVLGRGRFDAPAALGLVLVAVFVASRLTFGSVDLTNGAQLPRSELRQRYLRAVEIVDRHPGWTAEELMWYPAALNDGAAPLPPPRPTPDE